MVSWVQWDASEVTSLSKEDEGPVCINQSLLWWCCVQLRLSRGTKMSYIDMSVQMRSETITRRLTASILIYSQEKRKDMIISVWIYYARNTYKGEGFYACFWRHTKYLHMVIRAHKSFTFLLSYIRIHCYAFKKSSIMDIIIVSIWCLISLITNRSDFKSRSSNNSVGESREKGHTEYLHAVIRAHKSFTSLLSYIRIHSYAIKKKKEKKRKKSKHSKIK